MARFHYVGKTSDGGERSGQVEAKDQKQAVQILQQNNIIPVSLTLASGKKSGLSKDINLGDLKLPKWMLRVKPKELMVLTRQLATLMQSGLPLVRGLRILQKQAKNQLVKEILGDMSTSVEGGSNFSEALAQHPKVFDHLYVNMAKAGEAGGVLDQSLTRLAEFLEKAERIKNKVKSAMTYPVVVLCVAVLITGFLMVKVIPQFEKVFEGLMEGRKLPALTLAVMNFSKTFTSNAFGVPWLPMWLFMVVGIGVFVFLIKTLYKTKHGRIAIDRLKLWLPGVGQLLRKSSIARSTRTLGTLMQSGVPVLQALDIVRDTSGNQIIANAYQDVHDSVKEGESMTPPMERSKIFPPMVISMVDVGEETGALPDMLGRIANTYDDEVDNAVEAMTSVIEPVMIVFLALIVGTIVIAMFMPLVAIIEGMTGAAG